jgi:hypothetical protein
LWYSVNDNEYVSSFDGPSSGPRELVVDRPFIFAIVEEGSDVPLFAGKIHDPTGAAKGVEVIFLQLSLLRKI